ncbi:MAG: hypothetical protein AB8B85_10015 [Paracoccaceae bacterium]
MREIMYPTYNALAWFRALVFLGLLLNAAFFLPGLFAPRLLESWFDFGITNTVHWLQNVSLLLIIVTAMYIPVMRDPFRYIFITYLVVGGRFAAGSLFLFGVWFMDYPEGMLTLALGDLILSSVQAYMVYHMLRDGDPDSGWS